MGRLKTSSEFSHLVETLIRPSKCWSCWGLEPSLEQAAACLSACSLPAQMLVWLLLRLSCSGLLVLFGLRESEPVKLPLIQQYRLGLSVPPCDLRQASSPAPPALLSIFSQPKCTPGLFFTPPPPTAPLLPPPLL